MKRILDVISNFKVKSYVVINKYDLNIEVTNRISDWCFDMKIPVIGKIIFDTKIVEAMLNCQSIVEWLPETESSKEIINIWNKLFNNGQSTNNQ